MTSETAKNDDSAVINLNPNEAIVLFELLSRWADPMQHSPDSQCFQANAEGGVLLGILACLEKQLSAPLTSDYRQRLTDARNALAHSWDYSTLRGE